MKVRTKIIVCVFAILLFGFLPTIFTPLDSKHLTGLVFAQNTTPDLQEKITLLKEQIAVLQTQIAELKAQLEEIQKTEPKFTKTLQRGMREDEVKQLQEFLKTPPAGGPDIYPEGLVTGYFGSLTEKAVKKFQEKNGIEPIGTVGPKTRAKINELLSAQPLPAQISAKQKLVAGEPEPTSEPTISIDTHIVSGPEEGKVIEDTNEVTFEFGAEISPEDTKGKIYFEIMFEGLDEKWSSTTVKKITKKLPDPKEYTFLVRAKIQEVCDPTPAKRTFKINVSPYFGKVKISGTKLKTSSSPSLITLSTGLKKEEEINITKWSIRGKKGSFVIPKAIERYRHLYEQEPEDIVIEYGDKVYLSGAPGPLGRNINFRPNKCMGYLTNYHSFPISISKNCPRPIKEEISYLEPCCQTFINGLSRCEAPDYSQNLKVLFDPDCISFINNNLNYEGCFKNYSSDADFLQKSWHIYMDTDFLSKECDTLYLRDRNNLLVDKYDYGRLYCK